MKTVKYKGLKYTVESESMEFYQLSGGQWVKKAECKECFEDWDLAKEVLMGVFIVGAFIVLYLAVSV